MKHIDSWSHQHIFATISKSDIRLVKIVAEGRNNSPRKVVTIRLERRKEASIVKKLKNRYLALTINRSEIGSLGEIMEHLEELSVR